MKKLLLMFSALLPIYGYGEGINSKWNQLEKEVEALLIDGELEKARVIALELNKIDPSDTHVLYYLVLTYTELGLEIPNWLLEDPWPNDTHVDKDNFKRAKQQLKVHNKQFKRDAESGTT